MITAMIVEDQRMIRAYLESLLRADSRFRITESVGSATLAEQACQRQKIDLILMDVMTERGESGLEATRRVKQTSPRTKVVIVTSLADSAVLEKAQSVGADSLWYKDAGDEELMRVVERTLQGESVFPDRAPVVEVGLARSYEFTKKETDVLRYVMRGMAYPQIAAEMGVEITTVRYHITNMLQKTGLENKLQLALAVRDAKLIVSDL